MSSTTVDLFQIDWDEWRREHANLTFADQQAFYSRVAEHYPHQQSFDAVAAHDVFDFIPEERLDVVELGGWDGALAAIMLSRSDISRWTNYDLVEVPQVCRHANYRLELLRDYLWNQEPVRGDVFVACHTIEHLTARELELLFSVLLVPYVYLQSPLKFEPVDWAGYPGSHILEIGWNGVAELLQVCGFVCVGPGLWASANR